MLVLASASPRRQELLRNARIPFEVQPADIPEIRGEGEAPGDFARRLAREKARAVFQRLPAAAETLVLGADTIVVVDSEVLGKPSGPDDAFRMLRLLSGRWHRVTTAVCLIGSRGSADVPVGGSYLPTNDSAGSKEHRVAGVPAASSLDAARRRGRRRYSVAEVSGGEAAEQVDAETTEVLFSPLSDGEIRQYIATGEPLDKAGAYAIQGIASRWVPRIQGDYFNVMGLPVALIWRMLQAAGEGNRVIR